MIWRVWHIASREWMEQRRQPTMMAAIFSLFLLIGGLYATAVALLEKVRMTPQAQHDLLAWLPAIGLDPGASDAQAALRGLASVVVSVGTWLIFTQYLGITAVLAGHSVLYDRERGALPFLLLAPVRRTELLAGKILGAIGPSTLLYFAISGAASVFAGAMPVTIDAADRLPPSPQFLVAFVFGGPAWAAAVSAVAAVLSGLATDVRTAQQGVWFVMFFATFGCGYLLAGLLGSGVGAALSVAGFGMLCTLAATVVGGQVISRDLGR
jgi:ABC-type Na+ efflux pump permease subunit